jgi:alpha-N-arabinofuranosidase
VLSAPDIHAHNTFERPRTVQPRPQNVEASRNGLLAHEVPAASVTRLTIELA